MGLAGARIGESATDSHVMKVWIRLVFLVNSDRCTLYFAVILIYAFCLFWKCETDINFEAGQPAFPIVGLLVPTAKPASPSNVSFIMQHSLQPSDIKIYRLPEVE